MTLRLRAAALLLVGGLVAAGSASVFAMPELRGEMMLNLSPKSFRDAVFQRLANPAGDKIYLLGTIHGRHLTTPDYSLAHVRGVITRLRPDLVLVESRPGEIAAGNLGDGPIEALYADLAARSLGIPVEGIDWWTMDASHQVDSDAREDHMVQNIRSALPGHRKTLVLVGFSHTDPFNRRLASLGFRPAPFTGEEKDALFDIAGQTQAFPAGMARYLQRRIDADQALIAQTSDPFWRRRLADAVAARQSLLGKVAAAGER